VELATAVTPFLDALQSASLVNIVIVARHSVVPGEQPQPVHFPLSGFWCSVSVPPLVKPVGQAELSGTNAPM